MDDMNKYSNLQADCRRASGAAVVCNESGRGVQLVLLPAWLSVRGERRSAAYARKGKWSSVR